MAEINSTRRRRACITAFAAVTLVLAAAPVGAVTLPGSVATFAPDVHVLGDADPGARVSFAIALRPREFSALSARVAAGGRVSPEELKSRFLPASADYDAVIAWLRGAGLSVDRTYDTRLKIAVSGSAADVARVLGVQMKRVEVDGKPYVAAATAPDVPSSLAPLITGVNGLQPWQQAHKNLIRAPSRLTFSGYLPANLRVAYKANLLKQTGAGTTTAIIIDTFPNSTDLTTFWTLASVPQSLSNITPIDTNSIALPAPSGEETIDADMTSSMAPGSKVRIYATGDLKNVDVDDGYEAIILDIVNGVPIQQLSISLGECEATLPQSQITTDTYYHAILDSLGVTILIASGDSGAQECGAGQGFYPSFDSTSPGVTAVGGTTLHMTVAGVFVSESGWSDSGGGLSGWFATPSFQSSIVPALPSRAVPDVAAVGDPATGVEIILDGKPQVFGGTSVATPIWAGLMGLVNQQRFSLGKPSLGFLDSRIYPLRLTANFRDIKLGNNGYPAKTGYDLVTGIGAPLMNVLLPTLAAQN